LGAEGATGAGRSIGNAVCDGSCNCVACASGGWVEVGHALSATRSTTSDGEEAASNLRGSSCACSRSSSLTNVTYSSSTGNKAGDTDRADTLTATCNCIGALP